MLFLSNTFHLIQLFRYFYFFKYKLIWARPKLIENLRHNENEERNLAKSVINVFQMVSISLVEITTAKGIGLLSVCITMFRAQAAWTWAAAQHIVQAIHGRSRHCYPRCISNPRKVVARIT